MAVKAKTRQATPPRALARWMGVVVRRREACLGELSERNVHDLRVALRRCRALARCLREVDPEGRWRDLSRTTRKLFRRLGELRDAQVQSAWVQKLAASDDAVGRGLLANLGEREARAAKRARKALGNFDLAHWERLVEEFPARLAVWEARGKKSESRFAALALARLGEARALHARALTEDRIRTWHELRIAWKRLRYAAETLLPERYREWKGSLKRYQDLLGEVHDLDVLRRTLIDLKLLDGSANAARWQERLAREQRKRLAAYRRLTSKTSAPFGKWKKELETLAG